MATHPTLDQEHNQSYPARPNPAYATHINRGLGHCTCKWKEITVRLENVYYLSVTTLRAAALGEMTAWRNCFYLVDELFAPTKSPGYVTKAVFLKMFHVNNLSYISKEYSKCSKNVMVYEEKPTILKFL